MVVASGGGQGFSSTAHTQLVYYRAVSDRGKIKSKIIALSSGKYAILRAAFLDLFLMLSEDSQLPMKTASSQQEE